MNRSISLAVAAVAMQSLAVAMPLNGAVAQQMQRISFQAPAAVAEYTQQHFIDVGDLAGHQLRVFEVHTTFKDMPVINGAAVKELWTRGFSDFTRNSGSTRVFYIYVCENGDKLFARLIGIAHKSGSGFTLAAAGDITGGTGKFVGMRGTIRTILTADPAANEHEGQTVIEYALGGEGETD